MKFQKNPPLFIGIGIAFVVLCGLLFWKYSNDSLYALKSGTIVAANCGDVSLKVYWAYKDYPGIDQGRGNEKLQLLYEKGDSEQILLPSLSNPDLTDPVIGSADSNHYSPLPSGGSVPVTSITSIEKVDQGSAVIPLNIFVDPKVSSQQDFKDLSQCLVSHSGDIEAALGKAKDMIKGNPSGSNQYKIVGLAYTNEYDFLNKK
ncbi:MAG: hypothetical protein WCI89_01750 [bacterium]